MSASAESLSEKEIAEIFPVAMDRFSEAISYFRGEIGYNLPPWARKLCAIIGKEIIPKATREMALLEPISFTDGMITGVDVSKGKSLVSLFPKNYQSGIEKSLSAIPAQICGYLSADPMKRKAYFHGFTTGLDLELLLEQAFDRFESELENPKSLFLRHFYMWAFWPQFDGLDSPEDAFQLCNKTFAGSGREEIVGNKAAFRKFCERIGYYDRSRRLRALGAEFKKI